MSAQCYANIIKWPWIFYPHSSNFSTQQSLGYFTPILHIPIPLPCTFTNTPTSMPISQLMPILTPISYTSTRSIKQKDGSKFEGKMAPPSLFPRQAAIKSMYFCKGRPVTVSSREQKKKPLPWDFLNYYGSIEKEGFCKVISRQDHFE